MSHTLFNLLYQHDDFKPILQCERVVLLDNELYKVLY